MSSEGAFGVRLFRFGGLQNGAITAGKRSMEVPD